MATRANSGLARICNYICVVLMLVILIFQFMPFWHYTDDEETFDTSIQSYVWFPGEYRELDDYLEEYMPTYFSRLLFLKSCRSAV